MTMTFHDCHFNEEKLYGRKFHHFDFTLKTVKREKRLHRQSKVPGSTRWTLKKIKNKRELKKKMQGKDTPACFAGLYKMIILINTVEKASLMVLTQSLLESREKNI